MCTVWRVDKYKITFKLVINSRRISRGPVSGRGPAVEKHWFRPNAFGRPCRSSSWFTLASVTRYWDSTGLLVSP